MKRVLKENSLVLWRELLDLGIESSLAFLRRKKTEQRALAELKKSFFRQSQEHWQGLYSALQKLK
jgi:hypothetical protein